MATTICSKITASGRGAVGVVRLSGNLSFNIGRAILGLIPKIRYAYYGPFYMDDDKLEVIDIGISLFFEGPNSYTGEDVVEFQCHGGPVVIDRLVNRCLSLGATLARPGEFSERAFLNGKIDLVQAEAVADLISANSEKAARLAVRALQGEFSDKINQLSQEITELRVYVEAAMDFPDEEIDFIEDGDILSRCNIVIDNIDKILQQVKHGVVLQEGLTVVIAGEPNAGKSSLLNRLLKQDRAIVTDIAGTTRDSLSETIHLSGVECRLIDTAGLRETNDIVESHGVARAGELIDQADLVLYIIDSKKYNIPIGPINKWWSHEKINAPSPNKVIVLMNKVDTEDEIKRDYFTSIETQLETKSEIQVEGESIKIPVLGVSAKNGYGIQQLEQSIIDFAGLNQSEEGEFIARRRHLVALKSTKKHLLEAKENIEGGYNGDLVAEDLYQALSSLGDITGKIKADDLLGKIFGEFCIGK